MSEIQTETHHKKKKSHHRRGKSGTGKMTLSEIYDWPFEIDIELYADTNTKIAFLSGQEREYYPEKPGHSRHGVEYSMNCHPGDVPNPSYVHSTNHLQKPISNKGYGIGGLSAPRWKDDKKYDMKDDKKKIIPSKLFPKKDEDDDDDDEESTLEARKSNLEPKKSYIQTEMLEEIKRHKREQRLMEYHAARIPTKDECRQRKLAFGFAAHIPRFAKEKASNSVPGVGHYDVKDTTQCKKVPISTSFGLGPIFHHDTIFMNCDYKQFDHCVECLVPLISTDYYRSLRRISIPQDYFTNYSTHRETTRRPINIKSKTDLTELSRPSQNLLGLSTSKVNVPLESLKTCAPKYIAFCRSCYCDIQQLGHDYWTPKRMDGNFMKTRHCVNIHEHNSLPSFINKVPCKLIKKLKRKETLMNKHFPDRCEPMIKNLGQNGPWGREVGESV